MMKSNVWLLNPSASAEQESPLSTCVPHIEHNNALTFQRVMGKFDLYYEIDSGQNDYVVHLNRFILSFNPLARFAMNFPYFGGVPIRQAQLEVAVLAIASVGNKLYENQPYNTVMGQFSLLCGELPTPVFVYNYPYLYLRPYHPSYFGMPSFSTKYTMSERDEVTGVWLRRFVCSHFLQIGAMAQRYAYAVELP